MKFGVMPTHLSVCASVAENIARRRRIFRRNIQAAGIAELVHLPSDVYLRIFWHGGMMEVDTPGTSRRSFSRPAL